MQLLNNAQSLIMLALALAAIGAGVFAFVDALRNDAAAFASEGKQTKNSWLIALGIAIAVLFVSMPSVLNLFGLIGVVVIGVYLADVRPALKPYLDRKRRRKSGGATGSGPHGSW